MASNKEFSGCGLSPFSDERVTSHEADGLSSTDALMNAAALIGTWLSLRGMLFADTSEPTDLQRSLVREIPEQNVAALAAPEVRVNPWGAADFSQGAFQRRNLGVERN
ncbi:MAG TPA: hypothetical protein VIJ40_05060 [Acidimicrobiales bacterium]